MSKLTEYLTSLTKWENEKKRQKEEFTIDDSKHQLNQIKLIERYTQNVLIQNYFQKITTEIILLEIFKKKLKCLVNKTRKA